MSSQYHSVAIEKGVSLENRRTDSKESASSDTGARGVGNYGAVEKGGIHVLIDYFVPDSNPNLKFMEQESDERTLRRYTHNRKKVFTWTSVATFCGAVAVLLGTLCLTAYDARLFPELIRTLFDSDLTIDKLRLPVADGGFGAGAVSVISWSAGLATFFSAIGGAAGYMGFRTDIKNDVDVEELLAKRIGRHISKNLKELSQEQKTAIGDAVQKSTAEMKAPESPAPADRASATATGTPNALVSQAEAVARLLEQTAPQRMH